MRPSILAASTAPGPFEDLEDSMQSDVPPRRLRRAIALIAIVLTSSMLASPAAGMAPQENLQDRVEAAWAAAARGDDATALLEAEEILDKLGRRGDAAVRDAALVLRAACRYNAEQRGRAAGDLRDAGDALAVLDAEWFPEGGVRDEFVRWAEESGLLGSFDGSNMPTLSLEELNPEVVTHAVSSNFVMDVEIVRIPVIVEDISGDFISGLQAEQFEVVDGSPPAQPVYQLISDDEPTSLGVLIDASSGIGEHEELVRRTVQQLLTGLREEDEVFLVQFADEATFLSDFRNAADVQAEIQAAMQAQIEAEALAQEAEAQEAGRAAPPAGALSAYRTGGERALFDAVALGLIRMRTARYDKKTLILVSAGDDLGSKISEADLARAAQREGVAINTLLVAQGLARWRPGEETGSPMDFLQRLAHQTGGLVALRPAVEERFGGLEGWLDSASTDLSEYIQHQYLLLFESYDPPPHGEWRPLSVRVDAVYERVRARSGYVR